MSYPEKRRSNAWYLLPIFLGIIGGGIAFIILLRSDLRKAIYCLIIGAISMGISIWLNYWLMENIDFDSRSIVNI